MKNVFAFEFYDQNMVGVKGYDAEILEALTRHKVWILSKTSNANTITHFLKGSMKAIKRVESDLSKAYPNAEITLRKVALISAIGRNIADPTILARAIDALAKAEIAPLGVHALVRKVDLQVIIEESDFELAVTSLHRELIETRQLAATDYVSPLNAAA